MGFPYELPPTFSEDQAKQDALKKAQSARAAATTHRIDKNGKMILTSEDFGGGSDSD
jgi:hypothetical protein